jgi:hypothetical protein
MQLLAAALLLSVVPASSAQPPRDFVFAEETFTPTKTVYTFAGVDYDGKLAPE